ncbi:MAG TPA: hypothetical protein VFU02_14540 [Polyangiaceae bacterium]|nr:hypothetical protein [Polyangiaceae bacterium]
MGTTRVFFPDDALDAWLAAGKAELAAGFLTTQPEGYRYRVVEAVRVLGEVTGGADGHQLVGKVKPLVYVRELGAELLGDSMILDDNAYDIVTGWVAVPEVDKPAQHAEPLDKRSGAHQAEAEALAQFLARNL